MAQWPLRGELCHLKRSWSKKREIDKKRQSQHFRGGLLAFVGLVPSLCKGSFHRHDWGQPFSEPNHGTWSHMSSVTRIEANFSLRTTVAVRYWLHPFIGETFVDWKPPQCRSLTLQVMLLRISIRLLWRPTCEKRVCSRQKTCLTSVGEAKLEQRGHCFPLCPSFHPRL